MEVQDWGDYSRIERDTVCVLQATIEVYIHFISVAEPVYIGWVLGC